MWRVPSATDAALAQSRRYSSGKATDNGTTASTFTAADRGENSGRNDGMLRGRRPALAEAEP